MEPLRRLTAADVAAWLAAAAAAMAAHAPGLDQLDSLARVDLTAAHHGGDTGEHLTVTLMAVGEAVEALGATPSFGALADAVAGTSDRAVGTSGRLVVAHLAGFLDANRNADALDADRVALGLEVGAEQLHEVLGDAVRPGSLVTVAEALSVAALEVADEGGSLADQVVEVADAGLDALERTPLQWEPLADTGVVDSGAAGLLVLMDALVALVHGEDPEPPAWEFPDPDDDPHAGELRYEVSLRLDPLGADPAGAAERLRSAWRALGEQVSVEVGPGGLLHAAVRTDDIGAVVEASLGLGRPSGIGVRDAMR